MTDREFDDIIRASVEKYGSSYFDNDFSEHRFSGKFEKKMNSLIKRRKNNIRIISVISSAAAVIVISAVSVGIIAMNQSRNIPTQSPTISPPASSASAESSVSPPSDNNDSTARSAETNKSFTADNKSDAMEDNAADNYYDDIAGSFAAEAEEDMMPDNAAKANSSVSTSTAYTAAVLHKGQNTELTPEEADSIASLVSSLISEGDIVIDEEASAVTEDTADYVISVYSNSSKPVCYDENGNAVLSLTLYLSENKGSVLIHDTNRQYSFNADNAKYYLSQLQSIIS